MWYMIICTTNIINLLFSKCTHTCPAALVLNLSNQQTHGNILCDLQGQTQHIPQFEEMKLTPRIFSWPCHRANSQAISYLVAKIQLETHMAYMKLFQVAQYFLYTTCVKCLPLWVTEPAQHIALASSPFWDSSSWNRGQTEWNRQKTLQNSLHWYRLRDVSYNSIWPAEGKPGTSCKFSFFFVC